MKQFYIKIPCTKVFVVNLLSEFPSREGTTMSTKFKTRIKSLKEILHKL